MKKNLFSPLANGVKKSAICSVQPKKIREMLNMSQSKFASTFGIPLSTLQGWEQGYRKMDMATTSYLRTIMKFPNEVQQALAD